MGLALLFFVVGSIAFTICAYLFGLFRVTFICLSSAVVASLTIHFPYIFLAKDLRIGLTVLIFFVAVWVWMRSRAPLDPLIVAIFAFLGFYLFSASWSETPYLALAYKGLFFLMAAAGVFAGWAQRNTDDVLHNIRTLFLTFYALNILVWVMVLMEGGIASIIGRLDPYGLNANGIGERSMLLVVLGVGMLLYEKTRWKLLAQTGVAMGSVTMLLSGSRAALGACAVMLAIVLGRNVKNFILPALVIGGSIFLLFYLMPDVGENEAVTRLEDVDILGRWRFWLVGLEGFQESPLFGIGWISTMVNFRLSSHNIHSIYITVLSESGIIGALLMGVMLVMVIWRSVMGYLGVNTNPVLHPVSYRLMAAFAAFYVMKGLFESGLMFGTSTSVLTGYFAFAALGSPIFTGRQPVPDLTRPHPAAQPA